jgi:hypothetical protein
MIHTVQKHAYRGICFMNSNKNKDNGDVYEML